MTYNELAELKFRQGRVLYSDVQTHETILELWGGSTKHPDSIFHFSDFQKSPYYEEHTQIFQWLLECASKLTHPFHAASLARWALELHLD